MLQLGDIIHSAELTKQQLESDNNLGMEALELAEELGRQVLQDLHNQYLTVLRESDLPKHVKKDVDTILAWAQYQAYPWEYDPPGMVSDH